MYICFKNYQFIRGCDLKKSQKGMQVKGLSVSVLLSTSSLPCVTQGERGHGSYTAGHVEEEGALHVAKYSQVEKL